MPALSGAWLRAPGPPTWQSPSAQGADVLHSRSRFRVARVCAHGESSLSVCCVSVCLLFVCLSFVCLLSYVWWLPHSSAGWLPRGFQSPPVHPRSYNPSVRGRVRQCCTTRPMCRATGGSALAVHRPRMEPLSVFLSVCLCLYVRLSTSVPFSPSACLPVCLSGCLPVSLLICPFPWLSFFRWVRFELS